MEPTSEQKPEKQNLPKKSEGFRLRHGLFAGLVVFLIALFVTWPQSGKDAVRTRAAITADGKSFNYTPSEPIEESEPSPGETPEPGSGDENAAVETAQEPMGEEEGDGARIEAGESISPESHPQIVRGVFQKNDSLSASFERAGLDKKLAGAVVGALKGVFDFRKLRPGTSWEAKFNVVGDMVGFTYHYNTLEDYFVQRWGEAYQGYKITGQTDMVVEQLSGRIDASLSKSVWRVGETDQLTQMIADIFAWDIDFYSDVQKGDTWKVMVEKYYYKGRFVKYGRILCASFQGKLVGNLYAYYFQPPGANAEYYDDKGWSLQKSFLRAPLDTTVVTSKFGFRMHPIYHQVRKHEGVDYGAPSGTPIWAIASGRVASSGWMGACGNGVILRHDSGYESIYCHMSSVAVRGGQQVRQKQLIGRVGCTGACTGPHLHFGLKKGGKYMDPTKIKYEPGKPVAAQHQDRWKEARALLKNKLDKIVIADIYGPEPPEDYVDPTAPDKPDEAKPEEPVKKSASKTARRRSWRR